MPDFDSTRRFDNGDNRLNPLGTKLASNKDLIMEQILNNLNNTPIGQVLQKIASLPEVRRDKILDVRRQLTDGKYDLNERLDIALDKVLEDLTAQ
ncbi:MAG: flagellar biosynthesis anti-sigma factor FlgM [Sedimentisphaerales bacterium]|nr:flagellar biosynthesis anti-sigma factor FlgM [Sedimentisphaerales bacterium]